MFTKRKAVDGPAGGERSARRKQWELRLYVADWEPRSAEAWTNLNDLCEQHLPGLYKIEVVDLIKHPARSREDEILALPTVVRRRPQPEKRAIGCLSNPEKVLAALELRAAHGSAASKKAAMSRRKDS
jgi:circadian clock protein KaiB